MNEKNEFIERKCVCYQKVERGGRKIREEKTLTSNKLRRERTKTNLRRGEAAKENNLLLIQTLLLLFVFLIYTRNK